MTISSMSITTAQKGHLMKKLCVLVGVVGKGEGVYIIPLHTSLHTNGIYEHTHKYIYTCINGVMHNCINTETLNIK